MITILASVVILAALSCAFVFTYQKQIKTIQRLKLDNLELQARSKETEARAKEIEERYRINPGYDAQMVLADILSGQGLFKIERIERENLFLFRK